MKILCISKDKSGDIISVKSYRFWSSERHLEEVCDNIKDNRLSFNFSKTPVVTKSLEMRGAVFILDGHHRILQRIMDGETDFKVYWNPHYPYKDAGINNELPFDKINVVEFLNKKMEQESAV